MSKRPRGFIEYRPQAKARELIEATQQILTEYDDVLPLTLRQIFYVLVTRGVLDKTETEYSRLTETANKARRGHLIDWNAIRDDGFTIKSPAFFDDLADLFDVITYTAQTFRLDRQQGQQRRLQLWCEAAGMVPQLERVASPYGVSVTSSGGFDSSTVKHTVGRELAEQGPLTVLHLGDRDPSGEHMFSSLAEDVTAFAEHYGGDVEFIRLAVTLEQIEQYRLPTAPPKPTDRRSFEGMTTQCEALDPRTLAAIIDDAIQARFDMATYQAVLAEEQELRQAAISRLEQVTL
jgi:hypothetical protein